MIVVFECRDCGKVSTSPFLAYHLMPGKGARECPGRPVEVRLFHEETVRPLWEGALNSGPDGEPAYLAAKAFPAPESWSS